MDARRCVGRLTVPKAAFRACVGLCWVRLAVRANIRTALSETRHDFAKPPAVRPPMLHTQRFVLTIALALVVCGCARKRPPERHAELGETTNVKVAAIDAVMREVGAGRNVETGVVVTDAAEEALVVAGL